MTAYYNEHDPKAAAWLRELIRQGSIAPGEVDERSIEDVLPSDLAPFRQCHFFAGIGVWSYALRQAGWSDERPVWTGSCPCQPFSQAGKGGGFDDERHLWPAWFWLISQCRPSVIFGEQVASRDGLTWLDLVASDLEGAQFTFGSADLCAAGVGAPHIRQRLYFVAQSTEQRRRGWSDGDQGRNGREVQTARRIATSQLADTERDDNRRQAKPADHDQQETDRPADWTSRRSGASSQLADSTEQGLERATGQGVQGRVGGLAEYGVDGRLAVTDSDSDWQDGSGSDRETQGLSYIHRAQQSSSWEPGRTSDLVRELGNAEQSGLQEQRRQRRVSRGTNGTDTRQATERTSPSACNGFWRDAEWIYCRDDKWRAIESKFVSMADGFTDRMGRSGNSGGETERKGRVSDARTGELGFTEGLRELRQEDDEKALSESESRGARKIPKTEVLRPSVHGESNEWCNQEIIPKEQSETGTEGSETGLRNMRENEDEIICSPYGQEPNEQQSRQLADFVRLLPSSLAYSRLHGDTATTQALLALLETCGAKGLMQYTSYEIEKAWRSTPQEIQNRLWLGITQGDFVRTAEMPLLSRGKSPARVMRLRGYGNSIVAPLATEFIKAYMEIEQS